jgi:putative transposase
VRQFAPSATDVQALEDFHGRVATTYRARCAALAGTRTAAGIPIDPTLWAGWQGEPAVSRASFYRAVSRAWTAAEHAYWRDGEEARRSRRVWPGRASPHRNAIWQADHTQLEIIVVPGRGRPLRPWLTTFVDTYSRMIIGGRSVNAATRARCCARCGRRCSSTPRRARTVVCRW